MAKSKKSERTTKLEGRVHKLKSLKWIWKVNWGNLEGNLEANLEGNLEGIYGKILTSSLGETFGCFDLQPMMLCFRFVLGDELEVARWIPVKGQVPFIFSHRSIWPRSYESPVAIRTTGSFLCKYRLYLRCTWGSELLSAFSAIATSAKSGFSCNLIVVGFFTRLLQISFMCVYISSSKSVNVIQAQGSE